MTRPWWLSRTILMKSTFPVMSAPTAVTGDTMIATEASIMPITHQSRTIAVLSPALSPPWDLEPLLWAVAIPTSKISIVTAHHDACTDVTMMIVMAMDLTL